jgi:alpha-L-rhamnosidase
MGVPDDSKERVIAALKSDIEANGGHLDTGIFGTQFFFEVLSENGLHEIAYSAMNRRTMPSYGWWLTQDATTSWEMWNRPGSGNHPMFGGGMVWLYRYLAGMNTDPDDPGYHHIIFRPQLAGDLSSCSYSNLTQYGTASIDWSRDGEQFKMEIIVPVGSSATVYVPSAGGKAKVTGGADSVTEAASVEGFAVFDVKSGKYSFTSSL